MKQHLRVWIGIQGLSNINGSNFTQNNAFLGGALFVGNQPLLMKDCILDSNAASVGGGAIASLAKSKLIYNLL